MLVPIDMRSMIGPDHIVHVIDRIVEGMSLEALNEYYKGGGAVRIIPR